MLENLKSLKVKGGFFREETVVDLFKNPEERISFIFGRNGSGKTSISNALFDYQNNDNSNFNLISIQNFDSKEVVLSDEEKAKIFIFNEKFVDSQIKFSEDGINTIVMFGEQVELDKEISDKENEVLDLKNKYELFQENRANYENESNSSSPYYYKNKIIDVLKGDLGWSYREQQIKGNIKKTPVTDAVFTTILSLPHIKDIKESKLKLESNIKFLANASTDASKYLIIDFFNNITDEYIQNVTLALGKEIEKPELTSREKEMFNIILNPLTNNIEAAKKHFTNSNLHFCPFCFQEISGDYKVQLLKEFNKILNKDTEEHKKDLKLLFLDEISLNLHDYYSLDSNLCSEISVKIERVNKGIEYINSRISEKINNIYKPINIDVSVALKSSNELLNLIIELNKKIDIYNKNIDNIGNVVNESSRLNLDIARNEVNSLIDIYYSKINEYNDCIKNIESLRIIINNKLKEINNLNARKQNLTIALDIINKDLEYIFFGKDRLSLKYENNKYRVLSRGNSVELKKVSVGERNVIALCYFFALVLKNTSGKIQYSNDFFLLIDDPISSFDFENKIGIFSFLRAKLGKILKNNKNNKCVLLTHELESINNFDKFVDEFSSEYKNKAVCLNLHDKKTEKLTNIHKNNYTQAFICMYEYANNPSDKLEESIGNIMRKVIEAFSTFSYKQKTEKLMRDKEILSLIPENLREYFENFMYRLVLNSESHFSDPAKAYPEKDFYGFISTEEKQITAKNILVFMYIVNPIHVKKQLGGNKDYIAKVESWKKELETQV